MQFQLISEQSPKVSRKYQKMSTWQKDMDA